MEHKKRVKLLEKVSTQKKEHLIINNLKTIKKNIKDKGGKMKNEIKIGKPSTIDYDHVALILKEAEKHHLRWEVEQNAKVYIERDKLPMVEAYQHAFKDWVK